MNELEYEKQVFNEIQNTIKTLIKKNSDDLENYFVLGAGTQDENTLALLKHINNHARIMEMSLEKPYFARVDFFSYDDKVLNTIYIGKNGILDDDNIIVTDWRAPISDLYYSANIGEASYVSPSGIINGKLDLKRQFIIEDGILQKFYDVDLVSNDQLLQQYLSDNNDSRLKSIVSTIQKEQNDVIRKPFNTNLIIQGVAGSGKTTVALHRIAYLIYNNRDHIREKQYVVIGPNKVFLKYISNVLPDLDVSNVKQFTFEDFANDYIDEPIKLGKPNKTMRKKYSYDIMNDIYGFKCSLEYKNMLEDFLNDYIDNIFSKDLTLDNFKILDGEFIHSVFNEFHDSISMSFKEQSEITIQRLARIIENNLSSIISRYGDYAYSIFINEKDEKKKDVLRDKFQKDRNELKKFCKTLLRKYFLKANIQPTKLYRKFISNINNYNYTNYKYINQLKEITLSNMNDSILEFEDLASLMLIKNTFNSKSDMSNIKHAVIDEAQDYGEFNFYIFKKILKNANFSIFGDLAQSIYDYRSINNWEQANEIMFDGNAEIIEFGKSYRTTAEIMSVADTVASHIGLKKSELSIRHGEPVNLINVTCNSDIPNKIIDLVKELREKGYKTIGIISKNELQCRYLEDDLSEHNFTISRINSEDDVNLDSNRICNISSFLSKGLEFDAVIINEANEIMYSSEKPLDMKLLYVSITRALHEVHIIYSGDLTKPLKKIREEQNENIRIRK